MHTIICSVNGIRLFILNYANKVGKATTKRTSETPFSPHSFLWIFRHFAHFLIPPFAPNQLSAVGEQLELIIYTNCQFGRASNVRQQSVECVVKCKIWSKVCRGISQTCSHFIASLSLQIRLRLRLRLWHRQTHRASQMIRQRERGRGCCVMTT